MKISFHRLRDLEDKLDTKRDAAMEAGDFELVGLLHTTVELLVEFRGQRVEIVNGQTPLRAFVDDADQAAHEAERASSTSALENKGKADGAHRHVWGGPNGNVCTAVPGCIARPRKKKEAPAVEGGSQP